MFFRSASAAERLNRVRMMCPLLDVFLNFLFHYKCMVTPCSVACSIGLTSSYQEVWDGLTEAVPSIKGRLSENSLRWKRIGMQERHRDEPNNCQINQPLTLLLLNDGSTLQLALSHITESRCGLTSATKDKTSGKLQTTQTTSKLLFISWCKKKMALHTKDLQEGAALIKRINNCWW